MASQSPPASSLLTPGYVVRNDPTSPTSAPVPGADVRPILRLDLDAVCERLHVSTRELMKKLGQRDRVNLDDLLEGAPTPGLGRSASLSIGGHRADAALGVSPQVLSSLVGSQGWSGPASGGLRLPSPRGPQSSTHEPMAGIAPMPTWGEKGIKRSPSGFGFLVGQRSSSLDLDAHLRPECAPLLSPSPFPQRSVSPRVVGLLSREWHLPTARKPTLLLMDARSTAEPDPDGRLRAFSQGPYLRPTFRPHAYDPALLHRAAFIIPGATDGLSFVAVPERPEKVPLKKWLRLPKIPPEVQSAELVQRVEPEGRQPRVYLIVKFARPLFGWLVLLTGVTMMATVGPISDEILQIQVGGTGVSGFLLGSWNAQGLILCFFSWAVVSWLMGDWTDATYRYVFSLKGFTLMMTSGIISGAGSGCWTLSFTLTSVEQSYLFNSFHPTLIILCRLLSMQPVVIGEAVGLALGLCGAGVSAFTPDDKHSSKLFGDALAFMSSVSLCFYLLFSKQVRPHVPLPAMLTIVCFFSAVTQTFMAKALERTITIDAHPTHGVFGYLEPAYVRWWLFMLLVTSVGQAGYIGALKYLNPVVVSICMTSEPVMAMVIGNVVKHFLAQPVEWPTSLSLVGGLLIVLGSVVLSYFSRSHADGVEFDVTEQTEPFGLAEDGTTSRKLD